MVNWKTRLKVETSRCLKWRIASETDWKSREDVETSWQDEWRLNNQTKSRNYALWSFFTAILTAITDPKDWKAIRIKTDPAYYIPPEYTWRIGEKDTQWKVHRFSS
jgi:hypothetical protein